MEQDLKDMEKLGIPKDQEEEYEFDVRLLQPRKSILKTNRYESMPHPSTKNVKILLSGED